MTIIFQTSTSFELGRWENWNGAIPQKGDTIFDPSWMESPFTREFVNGNVFGRVICSDKPNEIIIYIK